MTSIRNISVFLSSQVKSPPNSFTGVGPWDGMHSNGELVQLLTHQHLGACGNDISVDRPQSRHILQIDRPKTHSPCRALFEVEACFETSLDTLHGQVSQCTGAHQTRSSSRPCVGLSIDLAYAVKDNRSTTQLSRNVL